VEGFALSRLVGERRLGPHLARSRLSEWERCYEMSVER